MRILRRLNSRPSSVILLGLVVGQGLVYGATPLISRLYTPSQVGMAALFIAAATTVGTVGIVRLDQRIASCTEDELRPIVRTAIYLAVATSITAGALWFIAVSHTVLSAIAFTLTTFAMGMTPLGSQLASRQQSFVRLGASKSSSGSVQALSQTGFGYFGGTSAGLLLGYAAGYWAGLVSLRQLITSALGAPSTKKWVSRATVKMCLQFAVASLVNSFVVAAIPLLMAAFYASDAVGHYAIAQRVAVVPAGLVVAALTPVIAAHVGTKLRAAETIRPVLADHMRRWTPIGLVVLVIPWLVPTSLVTSALGEQWAPVTTYMQAISPMIAAQVVAGPITQVLMMTGHGRIQLLWDISRFIIVLSAASLVAHLGAPAPVMAGTISITVTAFYLLLVLLAWRSTPSS